MRTVDLRRLDAMTIGLGLFVYTGFVAVVAFAYAIELCRVIGT